jgi:hypothetical protein
MVLLDIDEYIWPEYTPSPTETSPPTNKTPTNEYRDNDEERSLYESPQDRRSSLTATIVPSHVPRFSRRTKVCAATWLVVVLLALVVGLVSLPSSPRDKNASAAAAFNNTTDSSSSQSNSSAVPQSPAESSSSGSHEDDGSSVASDPTSNSTTTPNTGIDDPCPLELAAAQACFVDEHDAALTTSSLTYISASVAQSVCEACMVHSWPTLNASEESSASSALCGLDDDTACQELLLCECGSSCSGIVAAYLVCATSHSCHPSDDPEAWQSIPASCQQLLEVDPSQSSVDLLPPEISFGEGNESSSTLAPTLAPVGLDASSLQPTPVPRCLNESKAFDGCVDPVKGDSASCLLCLLSYWPSTPAASDNNTTSMYPACDDVLVNATCVGLALCAPHCNHNGCHDEYVGFLACQVETCHGVSIEGAFQCP